MMVIVLLATQAEAQLPVFNSVTSNTGTPIKYDKFELNINLTATYANAYDYGDIRVWCIFSAPSGRKDTVDGFFMQNYTLNPDGSLTPSGSGSFKLRYAPNETGAWTYKLSCTASAGTTTQSSKTFNCIATSSAGFIRKNATNYLSFDNGNQYFPVGENMGWQNSNIVTDYSDWVTKLANNNGNFIRVWMSSWAFALEWKNGLNGFSGLKQYKQTSAFYLDWLLDYCKQKDVYMMLTLNNHGQVSTTVDPEWIDNPYNSANGGTAANTWDFFTDATAIANHQNRLRYIIARYGYSQNIESWELFNEVDWTDQYSTYKGNVTGWHNTMANYIKSKDVYKHLVTTSYAYSTNEPATWSLSKMDFTQTHFYINSPNIESVLSNASQNYLTNYSKPTLNGEFGLGPSGATLAANDPNGIHIHNAIWGSSFSGAMGSAMTWWWDDYINPQNLYYHYKPLASFMSSVKLKTDNYKKATATTTGGGVSDVIITPGASFGAATSAAFTVDANGNINPGPDQLGQYLFGSVFNTQYHNPPTFSVTYPVDGQFIVTTGSSIGTSPQINIYVDGLLQLSQSAVINFPYAVNITAGAHTIKVDNLGTDWTTISNYTFANEGPPLTSYVLKSTDTYKASGWLLNSKYNWQYVQNHGTPPAVSGSTLSIAGMHNGNYSIAFFSTLTGNFLSATSATVSSGILDILLPDIAWDVSFRAIETSVLPLQAYGFSGYRRMSENYLDINISNADNVKNIFIERSSNGTDFTSLSNAVATWNSLAGKHSYIDKEPFKGNNFYRLKILDKDASISYSKIIKLSNNLVKFGVYPNPVKDNVILNIDEGKYQIKISDQNGRIVESKFASASGNFVIKIPVNKLSSGIYYLSVQDEQGNLIGNEKLTVIH